MINSWEEFFSQEKEKEYYQELEQKITDEYNNYVVYPPKHLMFNAFDLTPFDQVKVVIIGQDPYHNPNQAMGLAFSVPEGVKLPPSLKNIYKEIENEFHVQLLPNGDLTYLAKQGVFLLNTILTVRENKPLSHQKLGYEPLIENVIRALVEDERPKVFILWGNEANKYARLMQSDKHLVLQSAHPSPLSVRHGFFDNRHFVLANSFLMDNDIEPINWINYDYYSENY